jgi:hypothetical protein
VSAPRRARTITTQSHCSIERTITNGCMSAIAVLFLIIVVLATLVLTTYVRIN